MRLLVAQRAVEAQPVKSPAPALHLQGARVWLLLILINELKTSICCLGYFHLTSFSSIVFLIAAMPHREAKWHPIVWVIIFISTVSLMALTVEKPCHLEDGPGGLSALGLISNLAVLILCSIVIVFAIILRPRVSLLDSPYTFLAAVAWIALEIGAINIPWVWGYYNLKIHVVDWQGKPLANVKLHFLEEKTGISLDQAFLNDDVETNLVTDSSGNAIYQANNYRAIFGMANVDRTNTLRWTGFNLRPPFTLLLGSFVDHDQQLYIYWPSKERQFGLPAEKDYSASVPRPYPSVLTVFVPGPEGEDVSPYPVRPK